MGVPPMGSQTTGQDARSFTGETPMQSEQRIRWLCFQLPPLSPNAALCSSNGANRASKSQRSRLRF